ncbi:MAG: DNA helicase UvrD [Nitrospiraceae bacterium]|nr:MAG: DNA helicase UvrD [Nitrospiraceae bacterium]
MPKIIADLHIHSEFSRATSREMNVEVLALWAKKKGINLIGTGDFTHPGHFSNLKKSLEPSCSGLYSIPSEPSIYFMLSAEVSSIYKQKGKVRKIHNLIFAPDFDIAEKINVELDRRGNISSDGRPILGISARELLEIVLDISEDCLFVPAHAWTPWFSIFGSRSGFDSIEECFEEYSEYIYAIETGLSSDPEMNWRLSMLDNITLLSNSDAHSPAKIGREANVFQCDMDYFEIMDVIRKKDRERFLYTIEFFPEEGKYHFDGHRTCGLSFAPEQTIENDFLCPACKKPLTVGVMSRVNELADRRQGFVPDNAVQTKHLVPLQEIISEAYSVGVNSKKVKNEYEKIVSTSTEFEVMLDLTVDELHKITDRKIAEGILKVRAGDMSIIPGYDGVFGKVSIFSD